MRALPSGREPVDEPVQLLEREILDQDTSRTVLLVLQSHPGAERARQLGLDGALLQVLDHRGALAHQAFGVANVELLRDHFAGGEPLRLSALKRKQAAGVAGTDGARFDLCKYVRGEMQQSNAVCHCRTR